MAANRVKVHGRYLSLDVGSALLSGAPIAVGQICGVLMIDAAKSSPYTATIDTEGVYNLSVVGEGDANTAATAIAVGDVVYYDVTAGVVNVDAVDGIRFGWALGTVGSGATATIPVKLGPV